MKIVQVISSSAPSGAEILAVNLAKQLSRNGHEVHFVCPPNDWMGEELSSFAHVHPMAMKKVGWLRSVRFVSQLVRDARIDVVHTHLTRASYIGGIVSLLTNVPCITSAHVAHTDPFLRRFGVRKNRFVAVSDFVRQNLIANHIPDSRIDVVHNGTSMADLPSLERSARQDDGLVRFGIVGRIARAKGQAETLHAMRLLSDAGDRFQCHFIGRIDPTFEVEFQQLISELGVARQVHLLGQRNNIPQILDELDFTLMPSAMEAFGMAAVESMARRRPVIASNVGGLPEVVEHGRTGILINRDPQEIASAILQMSENCQLRSEMGRTAHDVVKERFTLSKMALGIENSYLRALS